MKVSHAAHSLNSTKRQEIGIHAIGGYTPISHVADRYGVSRKFVYQQKEKALIGIAKAFNKSASNEGEKVLFYIPVTKQWLCQVVLALIFICRASYQGVAEFFRDILDSSISKGTIHNIVHQHLETAKKINQKQDLSNVDEGLHDEIYRPEILYSLVVVHDQRIVISFLLSSRVMLIAGEYISSILKKNRG